MLRAIAMDVGPLHRHAQLRLLFLAQTSSGFGSFMTRVAVPYEVYRLTHSTFTVGALGAVEFVAIVVMALVGGAFADAADRRRMVLFTEAMSGLCVAILLIDVLTVGPGVLGLLYAAPSMGAVAASATSGWAGRVRRHGRAIAYAAAAWGVFIAVAGLARTAWLAVVLVALAGAADMISGLFRSTIWNSTIPDNLRGRLAGIEMISYTSGPLLGQVESGVVASLAGVRASFVSGGVLCVAGCAVAAAALPALWAYEGGGRSP